MAKELISEHTFLFPFVWSIPRNKENYLLRQNQDIHQRLFKRLEHWEVDYIKALTPERYNEWVYFYRPVQTALYTCKDQQNSVWNYRYKGLTSESKLVIGIKNRVFTLKIKAITLSIYKTGIGILKLHLINENIVEAEFIEAINQMNQCVYPPILPLERAREKGFPDFLSFQINGGQTIDERFESDYLKYPMQISNFILKILGKPFDSEPFFHNQWHQHKKKKKIIDRFLKGLINQILIEPMMGNYMFTICVYRRNVMPLEEVETNVQRVKTDYALYVLDRSSVKIYTKEKVKIEMYDQLMTLVLMQHITLLHFSSHIAWIANLNKKELVVGVRSIYENYIQFMNQFYFKEVTEEVLGSLIYEKLSQCLRTTEELKELEFELEQVHEYAQLIEQGHYRFKTDLMSLIGAALIIPTFVTGFFGMNILEDKFEKWWQHQEVGLWMNGYVFLPILLMCSLYIGNKRNTKVGLFLKFVCIVGIVLSICIILSKGCGI